MTKPNYAAAAQGIASLGRNGDDEIMHVSKGEVAALRQMGMPITTHPETGKPEAFNLGGLLGGLAGFGASFIPGIGPVLGPGILSALGAGLGDYIEDGDLGSALGSAALGFAGGNTLGALGADQWLGQQLGLIPEAAQASTGGANVAGAAVQNATQGVNPADAAAGVYNTPNTAIAQSAVQPYMGIEGAENNLGWMWGAVAPATAGLVLADQAAQEAASRPADRVRGRPPRYDLDRDRINQEPNPNWYQENTYFGPAQYRPRGYAIGGIVDAAGVRHYFSGSGGNGPGGPGDHDTGAGSAGGMGGTGKSRSVGMGAQTSVGGRVGVGMGGRGGPGGGRDGGANRGGLESMKDRRALTDNRIDQMASTTPRDRPTAISTASLSPSQATAQLDRNVTQEMGLSEPAFGYDSQTGMRMDTMRQAAQNPAPQVGTRGFGGAVVGSHLNSIEQPGFGRAVQGIGALAGMLAPGVGPMGILGLGFPGIGKAISETNRTGTPSVMGYGLNDLGIETGLQGSLGQPLGINDLGPNGRVGGRAVGGGGMGPTGGGMRGGPGGGGDGGQMMVRPGMAMRRPGTQQPGIPDMPLRTPPAFSPPPVQSGNPFGNLNLSQPLRWAWQNTPQNVQTALMNKFGQRFAEGGQVAQYEAPPAMEQGLGSMEMGGGDDRQIILEALQAIEGSHPNPQVAVRRFVQRFGAEAFQSLMMRMKEGREPNKVQGPGDGMSDSIPASINGQEPALLSDGEYVVPADAVSGLGNGSTDAGAARLDEMVGGVRQARNGTPQQPPQINPEEVMPGGRTNPAFAV